MSSSGLIYAAIALVWAAVLIPMWLRSHDSATESRSAERFGQAMRVLSRRSSDDVEPAETDVHPAASGDRVAAPPIEQPRTRQPRPVSISQRTILARRRARTLAVLAGGTLLLGLLAVAGVLPAWAPMPLVVLLVAFVVNLRVQAKRAEQVRRRRNRPQASPAAVKREADRPSRSVVVGAARRRGQRPAAGEQPAQPEKVHGEQAQPMVGFEDDDEAWRPNPLPLPTYVTAPKAMRPIRVIDLTTPGAWTSGRVFDEDETATEDLLAAEIAADELDAVLEHEAAPVADPDAARRAVGD